jgi:hypothetical protein
MGGRALKDGPFRELDAGGVSDEAKARQEVAAIATPLMQSQAVNVESRKELMFVTATVATGARKERGLGGTWD